MILSKLILYCIALLYCTAKGTPYTPPGDGVGAGVGRGVVPLVLKFDTATWRRKKNRTKKTPGSTGAKVVSRGGGYTVAQHS